MRGILSGEILSTGNIGKLLEDGVLATLDLVIGLACGMKFVRSGSL